MKRRKWTPKEKLMIVLEGLKGKTTLTTNEDLFSGFALLLIIGIGLFIACWLNGKFIVRSFEADDECVKIQRFNKQQVEIQWARIISVKHERESNSRTWIMKTSERELVFKSDGFSNEDWQIVSEYIKQHIPNNCQLKES